MAKRGFDDQTQVTELKSASTYYRLMKPDYPLAQKFLERTGNQDLAEAFFGKGNFNGRSTAGSGH